MILYNILYFFAFIFYLPILLVRGKWHSGFIQRFGFIDQEIKYRLSQKPNIWFHAVSVGEVLAIVGLVEKIRQQHPDYQVVISTVTKTGYMVAQKRFKKDDIIIYAPLDFGWSVRRFIKAIKPEIFIVAETELWPNLLNAFVCSDIPMVMVNGRISDRSFYHYQRFSFLFRDFVRRFRGFCMQSTKDADRIMALGASSKNVSVVGSMKFDDASEGELVTRNLLGCREDALIWVAGSTHPGEEKIVFDVFKKLKNQFPGLVLIIAPRHVERAPEVFSLATQEGFQSENYSKLHTSASPWEVLIVDTIGNLKALYSLADIVFVGKSLMGVGGQNIIEPAFFGKPVIVGPHMQNFSDITEIFLTERAIIQIQEAGELEHVIYRLLNSSETRLALGERARLTIQKNQGATHRTLAMISRILTAKTFVRLN